MLADPEYRAQVVEHVSDPVVKTFWTQEYARYTQRYEVEATAAVQNKVGQFTSNPLIRNIIGQTRSSIDMRKAMDEGKILLVNISKGRIGEDNSRLIGGLLITKLQLAAMSRVDIPEEERRDFFLYIDEFQHFATESFVNILSEARKYRLSLILSHQYIGQLGVGAETTVRDAVFGNVGTIVSFRVGAEDAEALEKEFTPEFLQTDFVNLGKYTIYVKLMIDGVASRPFSATTLPPLSRPERIYREEIIDFSRKTYAAQVAGVEEQIVRWSGAEQAAANPLPSAPQPQILYDARCSNCGKDTKVVFPPDGKRPVYCKSCRKKLRRQSESEPQPQASELKRNQEKTQEKTDVPVNTQQTPPIEKHAAPEAVSLNQAFGQAPVDFHPQKRQSQPSHVSGQNSSAKRPQRNIQGLQEILHEALQKTTQKPPSKKNEGGMLEPGETIYFKK